MKQPYTDSFGAPYDYKSTMHYDKKAFSSNGKDTIRTKVENPIHLKIYQLWNESIVETNDKTLF